MGKEFFCLWNVYLPQFSKKYRELSHRSNLPPWIIKTVWFVSYFRLVSFARGNASSSSSIIIASQSPKAAAVASSPLPSLSLTEAAQHTTKAGLASLRYTHIYPSCRKRHNIPKWRKVEDEIVRCDSSEIFFVTEFKMREDRSLAVPHMKRLGSIRKRPAFQSESIALSVLEWQFPMFTVYTEPRIPCRMHACTFSVHSMRAAITIFSLLLQFFSHSAGKRISLVRIYSVLVQ